MTDIKFCGLKTGRDVAAAEQAGARWTGYVFFEKSPRHVSANWRIWRRPARRSP
jgi:phosphoribosylanthranilate isomerase